MKKYVILFSVAVVIITSMVLGSNYLNNSIVNVDIIDVKTSSVQNTILCSGIIEYCDSQDISYKASAIVNDIFVKEGDFVKKGDQLLNLTNVKIDKNNVSSISPAEIENIANTNNIENIQDVYNNIVSESKSSPSNYTKYGDAYNIRAPISGIVSSVNVKKNSVIAENTSVITIADTDKMQVKLSVNESQISEIKVGQKAIVTGVGFKNSEYTGEVTNISNEAEKIVGPTGKETVVNVIVKLDNTSKDIKPGYTAKCRIIISEDDNVLLTPYESIKSDDNGKEYVYKYENGKAVKTYIETGNEYQNGFEIVSGLENGDKIIEKSDRLYSNCRVRANAKN